MAISNANLLQTKKPLSLPLLTFITIFLVLLNRVNSLSFNFNRFTPGEPKIILQGDAKILSRNTAIQLTKLNDLGNPVGNSVGRALYSDLLQLWDRTTGKVASFETSFTFVNYDTGNPGDGLAFFLAPPDTTIPSNSAGGFLGLFNSLTAINNSYNEIVAFDNTLNQVVAVEFDTYPNTWDPSYRHIGIDVNSIRSSASGRWEWRGREDATVNINYNSATKELRVSCSYPFSQAVTVSYKVDLKTILPERVRVGFSGSTGASIQTNEILNWSFSSTLGSSRSKEEDMYIARYM